MRFYTPTHRKRRDEWGTRALAGAPKRLFLYSTTGGWELFCAGEEADVAGRFLGEIEGRGGTAYAYRVALDGRLSSDAEFGSGFDAAGFELAQCGDITVGDAFDDKGPFLLDVG